MIFPLFLKSFDFLDAQEKNPFDLALLDICMPGMLGTDVTKEIRRRKEKTEIVFIATSDEFAVEAFSIQAAHYLVKPFSQEEFDEAMDRVLEKATDNKDKEISIKVAEGYTTLSLKEVIYAESDSHMLTIFMNIKRVSTMWKKRWVRKMLRLLAYTKSRIHDEKNTPWN
jgi:DNA-binding LytR/AlgR family response regulator